MFCTLVFVLLSFFFCSLCCLIFFYLRISDYLFSIFKVIFLILLFSRNFLFFNTEYIVSCTEEDTKTFHHYNVLRIGLNHSDYFTRTVVL